MAKEGKLKNGLENLKYSVVFGDGMEVPLDFENAVRAEDIVFFRNDKKVTQEESELLDGEVTNILTYKGKKFEIKSKVFEVKEIEE